MTAIARFAVGRPKHVLAAWVTVVSLLGFIGLHLERHLHQKADLVIPGSAFARADALATQRFGKSVTFAILFKGPKSAIDHQGRSLAATIERQPGITVLSPWQHQRALRPKPNVAVLIVRTRSSFEHAATTVVPNMRKLLAQRTRAPLESHLTGNPDVSQGLHEASVRAVKHAELLAGPLLMLVLLLVFRSPIAASLPLVIGGWTITASRGVLDLINRFYDMDALALNLCGMMGLALGVDYALLMVSRFREELRGGTEPRAAALTSVSTAGRTVVFAGIAVTCAMLAALFVTPGGLLTSATIGIVVGAVISVLAALTALPATLTLLGTRVNRWTIGRPQGSDSRFGLIAVRALRRPAIASALVLGLIALLAIPAARVDMGPPSPLVMSKDQKQRSDYETFARTLGQGWTSPYQVIVASRHGPITRRKTVAALGRFERRLSARRDVDAVLAPGPPRRRAGRAGRAASAVRFLVFGKGQVEREGHPLRPVLVRAAAHLAQKTGTEARVGGDAVRLQDYERVAHHRIWLLAIALSLVSYLVLVPVLRSVLLPLLTVALTALTVVASLGLLVLLAQGHPPVLGGPGFLEAVVLFGLYSIVFALSVDYQVFLLARIREGWSITGSTQDAVAYGLRRTAGVVTGAAIIMTGVFAAFATTELASLRELGIGLSVAVLFDATLVRLVLLPAAIRLFGDSCWWLPRPLARVLARPAPTPQPAPAPAPPAPTPWASGPPRFKHAPTKVLPTPGELEPEGLELVAADVAKWGREP